MLSAIYVLDCDFRVESFRGDLLQKSNKIFQNIAIFYPIFDDSVKNGNAQNYFGVSLENAKKTLENGGVKILINEILDKFEKISADFVVIIGGFIENLDEKIARNLNAPFFFSNERNFLAKTLNFRTILDFNEISNSECKIVTPIIFERLLFKKARENLKTIVFPESDDERILRASEILLKNNATKIILLGDKNKITQMAQNIGVSVVGAEFIDPADNEFSENFAATLFELRKHKGMSENEAANLMKDRTYFGTMLVKKGLADAMVSGANTTTAQTIRPALQFIKTKPGVSSVSGAFIMCLEEQIYIFADCAIMPRPSTDDLAATAIITAQMARNFGLNARVAMLSYSTGESGSGEDVDFVKEATAKAQEMAKNSENFGEILIDGPLQFDAAVDMVVAAKKMPNSKVAGAANVFIFPNLNCGNICYKAVQRTAGAVAIGPILQGLNAPINDLSRGCNVEDIVNTALISVLQS